MQQSKELKKLKTIHDSFKGVNHARNEDKVLILDSSSYSIFVVFDGVGSAKSSLEGVDLAINFIKSNHKTILNNSRFALGELMEKTNDVLTNSKLREPYCTYTALLIPEDKSILPIYSSVGDSRLYGVNVNYLHQYTIDDSLSEHVITKCLGMGYLTPEDFKETSIDVFENRFLMCTDGFYSLLESNISIFFHKLISKNIGRIKSDLKDLIYGHNADDCSYILIERNV